MSTHVHTNRLAGETSPYLLQHAHNPVDWYPWGPEALEAARKLDRPIFLSVGYSTCYWCHVMERQCFEVEAIAAEMNRLFVNIKVDREERPDIDQIYMLTVQIMTRQGGWPMSVFLTPDLRPFFGGTYFPPEDNYGRPGFPRLLAAISDAYKNRRPEVETSADNLVDALQRLSHLDRSQSDLRIDGRWIEQMIHRSTGDFDLNHGGFGSAPKFPRQTLLELLLAYQQELPDPQIEKQLRITLDAMAHGGIRDHLGGAFHRYSTDDKWLVPHFEIMLYDNAMLAWIYAQAYVQLKDERYAAVTRAILDFVLHEMTSPRGAFYTALDAEVDSREGGNYLWTREEVVELLKGQDVKIVERFCRVYGLDNGPNFADPHHGNAADRNVLYLAEPHSNGASALLDPQLQSVREILYAARKMRKQPLLDTKILTSWNALMIRAMAHAGKILKEDRYLDAASAAADFLLAQHRDEAGALLRVSAGGAAGHHAFLDDYAFLAQALLELADAAGDANRRAQAVELAARMNDRFFDPAEGGLFYSDSDAKDLITRQKIGSDSPLPSGNAVAAIVLDELGQTRPAAAIIEAFAEQMQNTGEGMSAMVQAAMTHVARHGSLEVSANPETSNNRVVHAALSSRDVVTIKTNWVNNAQLDVNVFIQNGFHLNASEAAPGLVATRLSVGGRHAENIAAIEYPPGRTLKLGEIAINGYQDEIVIGVRFRNPVLAGETIELTLGYQPCDATACLAPTTKRFFATAP
jgi:hypothetical protein